MGGHASFRGHRAWAPSSRRSGACEASFDERAWLWGGFLQLPWIPLVTPRLLSVPYDLTLHGVQGCRRSPPPSNGGQPMMEAA